MTTYTITEWIIEGKKRFGDKVRNWKFVCPKCNTVQSVQDLLDAGVVKDDVDAYIGYSCIGRFDENKGCDWSLGGLFHIHEAMITYPDNPEHKNRAIFQFAENDK